MSALHDPPHVYVIVYKYERYPGSEKFDEVKATIER